jgi:hypothetical protein
MVPRPSPHVHPVGADISRAPDVPNRSPGPPQLHTRPPTDDAALAGHRPAHDRRHRGECAEWARAQGTLIHHAPTRAIGSLVVAMIQPTFGTLLMAPARRADRHAAPRLSARRRTVGVSAIAGAANAKGPSTGPARAHTERRLHEAAAPSARPRRSAARPWENGSDLIRPAAASSRSRGPGGRAPGPHASLSRGPAYRATVTATPCAAPHISDPSPDANWASPARLFPLLKNDDRLTPL